MQSLADQYRPDEWSAVAGQDKVIRQLDVIRKRRGTLGGQAYFLSGLSGTGKTSIARLIAKEIADSWAIVEIDASELTAERIREIEREFSSRTVGALGGRAYIVNEVHGLSTSQVRKLLSLIEPAGGLPSFVVFCFTTTIDGKDKLFDDCIDHKPFLSRCVDLQLARRDLAEPMAKRLLAGAQAEGLDGQPLEKYVRLVRDHGLNMRSCWQFIESGGILPK